MFEHRFTRAAPLVLLTALAAVSCGDTVGPDGTARVRVLLTDAPADYIGEASVDIGVVELIPADGGDPVVLSEDGTDGPINLLDLQGAATTALGDAEVEAGRYAQIRLIVESASVTLADDWTFDHGENFEELTVPSGAQTGIKLNLKSGDEEGDGDGEGGVEIASGETILVLDFDVNQSYVLQGNPETPAGIKGVHFKPTLRVIVNDVAGSISGTVSTALDSTSVEGLTVTAEPADEGLLEAFQTEMATTTTGEDGSYTIHFVVPGTYTVTVETGEGLTTDPESVEVSVGEGEAVTEVDFAVVESGG